MNRTERRLTERLVETGRIAPETLRRLFETRTDGTGLIDTLMGQNAVDTRDVERLITELSDPDAPGQDDDPLLATIRKLDRYSVLCTLGRGGVGCVYLAYDTKLRRSVALKAMRVEREQDLARYRREVEIASSFHHPQIAAVYDTESVDDLFVIAMQYIDGEPLDKVRLTVRESVTLAAQAARALEAAHRQGVIHRDLKPGNLMRTPEGRVYLLDFGTARAIEGGDALTLTGGLIGTPSYMSPEQARGEELDARTDVYSLGATLYSLVTHQVPFVGTGVLEIVRRVASESPPPPRKLAPTLDRDVERIILKAMSPDLSHRYASVGEMAEDLERNLGGEPVLARPVSLPVRTSRYFRRRPWAMATLVAALLGILTVVGVSFSQMRREARLSEARDLIEQAGTPIDQYDQLIYLPPQDLTPYRKLLGKAETLCRQAGERAGEDLSGAHLQLARAAIRRGDGETAEAAIDRAVALEPSATPIVERIRIRLQRLKHASLDVEEMISEQLMEPWRAPSLRFPPLSDETFRQALLEDFERVGGPNADAEKTSVLIRVLEDAIHGNLARAEETAQESRRNLQPGERAELDLVLALLDYQAHVEDLQSAPTDGALDYSLADRLDMAIVHVTKALEIRESDADLYAMRALLHLGRAAIPMRAFHGKLPAMLRAGHPGEKERWNAFSDRIRPELPGIETWIRECAERARKDLDAAILIRPDHAEFHLIYPAMHALSVPLGQVVGLADTWAAQPGNTHTLPFFIRAAGLFKLFQKTFFGPAEEACRRAIDLDPELSLPWASLVWMHGFELQYSGTLNPRGTTDLQEETLGYCARALERAPQPRMEAMIRGVKARIHLRRAAHGQGDREEERQKALAEIDLIQDLVPTMAEQLRLHRGAGLRE